MDKRNSHEKPRSFAELQSWYTRIVEIINPAIAAVQQAEPEARLELARRHAKQAVTESRVEVADRASVAPEAANLAFQMVSREEKRKTDEQLTQELVIAKARTDIEEARRSPEQATSNDNSELDVPQNVITMTPRNSEAKETPDALAA